MRCEALSQRFAMLGLYSLNIFRGEHLWVVSDVLRNVGGYCSDISIAVWDGGHGADDTVGGIVRIHTKGQDEQQRVGGVLPERSAGNVGYIGASPFPIRAVTPHAVLGEDLFASVHNHIAGYIRGTRRYACQQHGTGHDHPHSTYHNCNIGIFGLWLD